MEALTRTLLGTAIAALFATPLANAGTSLPPSQHLSAAARKAAPIQPAAPTDRLVVKFRDDVPATGRSNAMARVAASNGMKAQVGRRLAVGANVVRLDRKLDHVRVAALLAQLRADPAVEYAVVDRMMHRLETPPAPPSLLFAPTDPDYATDQWHYHDPVGGINAEGAWDVVRGAGAVVAVLDTGITDHPDLIGNTLAGGYDFISDGAVGGDGGGRDSDPHDPGDFVAAEQCGSGSTEEASSWHGTHVAGTVAATASNGIGGTGVAFKAKVLPVRVLGKCGGYNSDIADAIVWASGGTVPGVPMNANPAEVINMSLGGGGSCDPMTQEAINTAVANGSVVVVAAGNSYSSVEDFSPASCQNVITVASNDQNGARSYFSNAGGLIDVAGPGGSPGIHSTVNAGATVPGAHVYGTMQGTSMAAPHVAGIAALMQALDPNSPARVEELLKATARAMPGAACPGTCGAGRVDASAAIDARSSSHPTMTACPRRGAARGADGPAQRRDAVRAGRREGFAGALHLLHVQHAQQPQVRARRWHGQRRSVRPLRRDADDHDLRLPFRCRRQPGVVPHRLAACRQVLRDGPRRGRARRRPADGQLQRQHVGEPHRHSDP